MTLERVWAAVFVVAVLFMVSTAWSRVSVAQIHPVFEHPSPHTTTVTDSGAPPSPSRGNDAAQPRVDLNGNEVDDAVSDYRVDGRGEMYERHAPDTALLHLSAPEL